MNRDFGELARNRLQLRGNPNTRSSQPAPVVNNSTFQPSPLISRFNQQEGSAAPVPYSRPGANQPAPPVEGMYGTPTPYSRPESGGGTATAAPPSAPVGPPQPFQRPGAADQAAAAPLGLSPYGQPLTGPIGIDQWDDVLGQDSQVTNTLRAAYEDLYGPISDEQLVGLVNKVVNEGYPLSVALQMVQQGYNIDPLLQRASDLVQLEMGSAEAEIERLIQQIIEQRDRDIQEQQIFGTEMDERLAGINQVLLDQLTQIGADQQSQIAAIMDQTAGLIGGNGERLQGLSEDMLANMEAYANELGLSEGAGGAMANTNQYLNFAEGMNLFDQNNAVNTLSQLGAIENATRITDRGIAARSGADQRAHVANLVAAAINDIYNGNQQALNEQYGSLDDLARLEGANLRETLEQLEQLEVDRGRQAEIDALDRLIAENTITIQNGQLAIQQSELELATRQQEINQTLAIEDLNIRREQLEIQRAELRIMETLANNDLQRQQIAAQIAQIEAGIRQADQALAIDQQATDQAGQAAQDALDPSISDPPDPHAPAVEAFEGQSGVQALNTWEQSRGYNGVARSYQNKTPRQWVLEALEHASNTAGAIQSTDDQGNTTSIPGSPSETQLYFSAREYLNSVPFPSTLTFDQKQFYLDAWLEGLDVYFGGF